MVLLDVSADDAQEGVDIDSPGSDNESEEDSNDEVMDHDEKDIQEEVNEIRQNDSTQTTVCNEVLEVGN